MPSINDWAAKAAERIMMDLKEGLWGLYETGKFNKINTDKFPLPLREERVAAVIATFAEPLMRVLRDSKRTHVVQTFRSIDNLGFDIRIACPAADDEHAVCTCGADDWNARVDAALAGKEE